MFDGPRGIGGLMAAYSAEACDELINRRLVHDAPLDEATRGFLSEYPRASATGLLIASKQIYDLVHGGEAIKSPERTEASRLGSMVMLYADLVDEQADLPGVPTDQKVEFFGTAVDALIDGDAAAYTPRTTAEEIVLGMGAQLHERYIRFDSGGLFRELFHKLGADAQQQVVSQDLQEQLELSVEIGKGCAGIYACSSELIDGRPVEKYAPALAGYGALAECLDNAYEITQDLREGSNTYATLWIRQHGDSRDNHRQARSTLAQRGMREYNNGRRVLNPKQAGLYSLMGRVLSTRYKVARGIRGSIGPKVLLAPAYEA
jgi:hypothetical protein